MKKRTKKTAGKVKGQKGMRIYYSASRAAATAFPLPCFDSCPASIDRWQCPIAFSRAQCSNGCFVFQEKRSVPLSGPLVTTALFGLQGITADYPVVTNESSNNALFNVLVYFIFVSQVRRIIDHLSTDLIESHETLLDTQNIANGWKEF